MRTTVENSREGDVTDAQRQQWNKNIRKENYKHNSPQHREQNADCVVCPSVAHARQETHSPN